MVIVDIWQTRFLMKINGGSLRNVQKKGSPQAQQLLIHQLAYMMKTALKSVSLDDSKKWFDAISGNLRS